MRNTRQRGGTLVEAAVVLLLFLVFLMAILEFGRAYDMYQVMTNAAREGARFAVAPCSLSPSSCAYGGGALGALPTVEEVKAHVNVYLASANINPGNPDVHVYVCRKNDTGDCGSVGSGASACDGSLSVQRPSSDPLCETIVQVSAPYNFIFMQATGISSSVTMKAQARMRDETN